MQELWFKRKIEEIDRISPSCWRKQYILGNVRNKGNKQNTDANVPESKNRTSYDVVIKTAAANMDEMDDEIQSGEQQASMKASAVITNCCM
jgi:hypothetical protein